MIKSKFQVNEIQYNKTRDVVRLSDGVSKINITCHVCKTVNHKHDDVKLPYTSASTVFSRHFIEYDGFLYLIPNYHETCVALFNLNPMLYEENQ